MRRLIIYFGIAFLFSSQAINAQEIFKKYGFDKEPLTLSNGRYNEFFSNDEIVQIGTVLLNTKTNQVVSFIEEYSTKNSYSAELSSRWLSIDPLAAKYPQVSPYVFVLNNPIKFIDPDGKDVFIMNAPQGAGGLGHMGAIIQDGNGNWYYMTQGAADPNGNVSNMTSGGVQGGMALIPLGTKDKAEALELAKQDKNNSAYTDQIEFKTSSEMDAKIFSAAQEQQERTNSGELKYNLFTNNCVDAVQDPIEKGTGVKLPKDIDPRPNKYFDKLKRNQEKVQKKIDKEVQRQETNKQKENEDNKI